MWTWLLCTFVETQEANPLRSVPPLCSGDSPCSICRNLLAELSLTALFYGERERGITKILLLPGAAWFSFEGLLNIFLTFSLNLVFPQLLWLYLIQCSLGNVYLYTHMLWMLISSPCGKQYVPISLGPFPSGSLGVFPSIRLSQNPAEPLAHCLFSCGGIGRHRLWWCQTLNLARIPESHLYRAVCLQWPSRWLSSKESTCSAGDAGDVGLIPGSGRSPREGNSNPLQHSCLEKSHGQKSLVGCSPWGLRELDTTKHACVLWMHQLPFLVPPFPLQYRRKWWGLNKVT